MSAFQYMCLREYLCYVLFSVFLIFFLLKEPSEKAQLRALMEREQAAETQRIRDRAQSLQVLESTAAADKVLEEMIHNDTKLR